MTEPFAIRPIRPGDYTQWRTLWDGYNIFYGRSGPTALPEAITTATWERFFSALEPVHAFVAEHSNELVGLVHYLFHRSTTRLHDVCYLQDLYTKESLRGKGAGRQMIQAVFEAAKQAGSSRVYWMTHTTNDVGRALYDKMGKYLGFIVYVREL